MIYESFVADAWRKIGIDSLCFDAGGIEPGGGHRRQRRSQAVAGEPQLFVRLPRFRFGGGEDLGKASIHGLLETAMYPALFGMLLVDIILEKLHVGDKVLPVQG